MSTASKAVPRVHPGEDELVEEVGAVDSGGDWEGALPVGADSEGSVDWGGGEEPEDIGTREAE